MTSLFISYSRKDIDSVRQLTEAFKRHNLDFWIDWEGIPPTVDWWKEIERGIEEADAFLFLLSPDSVASKVCERELEHAARNGKRFIPVIVRDVKADEVPPALRSLNWIFFRPGDDFDESFGKLITALKTDYDWLQAHRQLQAKALEWERNNQENSFLLRGKELQEAEVQLARNASKEPNATDLQREYVIRSRQSADQQRRLITTIAVAGAIVMAILAVFGFVQANLANERARVAHLRELAAQSALMRDQRLQTSLLLGLEVFRQLGSNPQTLGLLLDNVQSHPQLRQFMVGHSDAVNSVAVSPDGKTIASGGSDNAILLWDATTHRPIGEPLTGHLDSVNSIAFSPDGGTLASGSDDNTIILWDVQTHQQLGTPFSGHAAPVNSVAFSPDGTILASGSADKTIILWDIELHERIGPPLSAHTGSVNCIAFHPDGKTLVSGSTDKTIRLWDMETYQAIDAVLQGHLGSVDSLAFSPDGTILLSGSIDARIIVWDFARRQQLGTPLTQHGSRVNSIAFSPDGELFASGSN
ncbi:MAG TPA: TIR domain-containing protein, partial [Anaerolineales bacterium]